MWCGEIPVPPRQAVCVMGNISCRHKTNCTLSFVLGKSVRVTFSIGVLLLLKKLSLGKTHPLLVCTGSNQYFLYMDAFILGTPPSLTGNLSLVCWHTCRKLSFEVLQTECGIFLWASGALNWKLATQLWLQDSGSAHFPFLYKRIVILTDVTGEMPLLWQCYIELLWKTVSTV